MKTPTAFPEVITVGNAKIKIYPAPVKGQKKDKSYASYLISYYEGGKRRLCRRGSYDEAYKKAKEIAEAIRESDFESIELSGRDRRIYLSASEKLSSRQLDLDQAVDEYAEAYDKLKPFGLSVRRGAQVLTELLSRLQTASLDEVVAFYERHGRESVARKRVPEISTELLNSLEKDNCGKYHLRDLKTRLGRFGERFDVYIDELRENQIVDWLQSLTIIGNGCPETDVRVSPKTRNNYLNALTELFNFSKSRGYLPKLLPTAVEKVKRLKGPKLRNNILVSGDMTRLLESATGDLLPPLAIKAFSGVRTEEMSKLSWDAVKFNQRSIIIEASISKLGQRRVVPLVNNLALWLEPFKNQTGIICKKWSNPHQLSKAWKKFGAKIGVNITKNSFRNSYISYRLALPTPSAIVAQECGNSPRIIESEYKELATNDEGVAWFDIRPPANYLAKMKEELAKSKNTDITPV